MKTVTTKGRGRAKAEQLLQKLEHRGLDSLETVMPKVRRIVSDVRRRGDRALLTYARRFDGISDLSELRITQEQMQQAWEQTPAPMRAALKQAAANIRRFAERQRPKDWSISPTAGLRTGQLIRPLGAAGCYVPSGRYPLPSTLLMTAIPAQVAGVPRIVAVSPKPALETLAAAHMLGIQEFYRVGGAQAVAALAYGTETIARVDKIAGPGSLYVTAAKKLVSFDCGIDMLAGPTEIVVTSDTLPADAIASDLVAQAEHDPEALPIFVTTQATLATAVTVAVRQRVTTNPIARQAVRRNGVIFVASNTEEARGITNRLAPEHLTVDSEADLAWVQNAGSVFVGRYSPQPMGDYVSGPNHTLPTGGMANLRGGLSVWDFLKIITVQTYTREGLKKLAPSALALARAEGLTGHAEAILARGIK